MTGPSETDSFVFFHISFCGSFCKCSLTAYWLFPTQKCSICELMSIFPVFEVSLLLVESKITCCVNTSVLSTQVLIAFKLDSKMHFRSGTQSVSYVLIHVPNIFIFMGVSHYLYISELIAIGITYALQHIHRIYIICVKYCDINGTITIQHKADREMR